MNPFIAERSDGLPLNLNDQLLLVNGVGITVREFIQMVGGGGGTGLKFGEIEVSPTTVITDFQLSANTVYENELLSPNPEGTTTPPYDVKYTRASTNIEQEFILDFTIPEAGYVAITVNSREVDVASILFGNEIVPNFFAIGFAMFGGQYQAFLSDTFNGDGTSSLLPSGSITSANLRLILGNGIIRIEGIPPNIFSIPIDINQSLQFNLLSIGFISPIPQPVNFVLQSAGSFVKPEDWAVGNFYTVLSGGELYGYLLNRDDFILVSGEDSIVPFRFGDFITRLEIVGIISDTVDGYIVSAPVQALLQNMTATKIASMMQETGPGTLQDFVYKNDYSRVWENLFSGENSNGTIYRISSSNPEMIYVPDRDTDIVFFIRSDGLPTDVPSFHRVHIANTFLGRSVNFSCFDGQNTAKLQYGGDLIPGTYSPSEAGYQLQPGEGMIAEIQIFPVAKLASEDPNDILESIVFLKVTKVSNPFNSAGSAG